MPAKPKHILHLRPDTIGDLVIFSSALAQLQAFWPDARHTLVVRAGYETLAPLFPTSIQWHVARINPFTQKPSECRPELAALLQELEALQPDVIVAGAINRTWLELAVAAHFPHARCVALGSRPVDPLFAVALRLDLGITLETFPETVEIDERSRDWESNHRLADHLAGTALPRRAPKLEIPLPAAKRAAEILVEKNLSSTPWVAVFAGGLANVPIKAWQMDRFAALVRWLQKERNIPVLLLGHTTESALIEQVANGVTRLGGDLPPIWLGRDGEIPLLAALLASAEFYVGHDTGAMHIAAAVERPVVGIFGGGHWPRFRPVGRQAISVVQPLPCFGCNWDCHFGDAPCVKSLAVADVQAGIDRLLAAEDAEIDEVIEARRLSEETLRLIAGATPRYRALQRDRIDRQHKIEELKRETDSKDAEIEVKDDEIVSLKREADSKDVEIAALKRETDHKDVEIADLKKAADEIKAELEAECAEKDAEITELKGAANRKDAEITNLKGVCDERERVIFILDGHVRDFQKLTATQKEHLAEKEQHALNLQAELTRLAEHDRTRANAASGSAALKQANHYGQLLAEKEAVIQNLHRACVDREAVIKQLTAETTGALAKPRKLWIAAAAHTRAKWWRPFETWLFKKVVDDYWMQIGVLRHYDPRPISWEKFPKPRLPETRLPKIGIVTPSYGQATFVESTMLSVLNQNYPKLIYAVQDGESPDASPQIIARYASRLRHWESTKDSGQADAIRRGFSHIEMDLAPDDLMAWLNSDDFIAPRALRHVAEYFATHPEVDVIYGHRIIIDGEDREIGRWIMPRHDRKVLEWIDYVPQETLFWRKRAWDLVGGIDPSFQFALDWDLLARFIQAGCRIERLPRFLGCFRVHHHQKTSQAIHTTGADEMKRIRTRFHGERQNDFETIDAQARKTRFRGAITARLHSLGIRW